MLTLDEYKRALRVAMNGDGITVGLSLGEAPPLKTDRRSAWLIRQAAKRQHTEPLTDDESDD